MTHEGRHHGSSPSYTNSFKLRARYAQSIGIYTKKIGPYGGADKRSTNRIRKRMACEDAYSRAVSRVDWRKIYEIVKIPTPSHYHSPIFCLIMGSLQKPINAPCRGEQHRIAGWISAVIAEPVWMIDVLGLYFPSFLYRKLCICNLQPSASCIRNSWNSRQTAGELKSNYTC